MMKNSAKLPARLLVYFFGLLCLAFGVALAIKSNLGISSISSFPYAVYQVLLHNGIGNISYGTCITFSHLLFMLVQFAMLRRNYKPINLIQVIISTIFGRFVDFASAVVGPTFAMNYFARLGFLAVAILLIALGISLYIGTDVMPMPGDGMSVVAAQKLKNYPFHKMRRNIDCVLVTLAILISFVGTGHVVGVREGTVINALLVGPVMGRMKPLLAPLLQKVRPVVDTVPDV